MVKDFFYSLDQKIRFIISGGINTVLGYLVFIILYYFLNELLHYQIILFLSYVININISFISMQLLVFVQDKQKNLLKKYFKSYVVYLLLFLLNAFMLKLMLYANINVYLSQFIIVATISIITFFLHKYFTFKVK